jgi:hypothetical protein
MSKVEATLHLVNWSAARSQPESPLSPQSWRRCQRPSLSEKTCGSLTYIGLRSLPYLTTAAAPLGCATRWGAWLALAVVGVVPWLTAASRAWLVNSPRCVLVWISLTGAAALSLAAVLKVVPGNAGGEALAATPVMRAAAFVIADRIFLWLTVRAPVSYGAAKWNLPTREGIFSSNQGVTHGFRSRGHIAMNSRCRRRDSSAPSAASCEARKPE